MEMFVCNSASNEELSVRINAGERGLIERLWAQVYRFIKFKAERYYSAAISENGFARFEVDDLIQQGYFALLKAVKYYDPASAECTFLTVLNYTLKTAFAEVAGVRSAKLDAILFSESGDRQINDDRDCSFFDMVEAPQQSVEDAVISEQEQQELHAALERCMMELQEHQRNLLRQIYYCGRTQESLAAEYGCTPAAISQQKAKALKKLYDEREENGLIDYLDAHTDFYRKGSVQRFKTTGESVVESLVFKREQLAKRWLISKCRRRL